MELLEKYLLTRKASEQLCAPLAIEDYVPQPAEFVSPPKWNLGHTTWFFEEIVLSRCIKNYKTYHPKFSYIFNSYYQALGERAKRAQRGDLSRPTVEEVYSYRKYVDDHICQLLTDTELDEETESLLEIGINHEQQHQELFYTDLKYTFSLNPLIPVYAEKAYCEDIALGDSSFLDFDAGLYEVGYKGTGFAYDNESPRHRVHLNAYNIASKLVTNQEYLEFVESGGYENSSYWHDEAWTWLTTNTITAPVYWQKQGEKWYQYTLAGLRDLQSDAPCTHVSYFEAYAFAQWRGMRLPTEFEWEVAADKINWGQRWEWTESAYLPYPGYTKFDGALGEYNGKFMVNQKVLRGSSVVTPKGHERKTYRNFFHPHMPYQFNGIRLAK
jgi:ergothioneine biosynthesis protein EgtB